VVTGAGDDVRSMSGPCIGSCRSGTATYLLKDSSGAALGNLERTLAKL
jgi:hypothetical protein